MYTLSHTVYRRNYRRIIYKFILRDMFLIKDITTSYEVFARESTLMRDFYD